MIIDKKIALREGYHLALQINLPECWAVFAHAHGEKEVPVQQWSSSSSVSLLLCYIEFFLHKLASQHFFSHKFYMKCKMSMSMFLSLSEAMWFFWFFCVVTFHCPYNKLPVHWWWSECSFSSCWASLVCCMAWSESQAPVLSCPIPMTSLSTPFLQWLCCFLTL